MDNKKEKWPLCRGGLKVSSFQNETLMSKIFQNCNKKIVRISAIKYGQTKEIRACNYTN